MTELAKMNSIKERLSRQLGLSNAEAADLVDAYGIRQDFETVKKEAAYLMSHYENHESIDFVLVGAVSTSILVNYCRPFSEGVRNQAIARNLMSQLSKGEQAHHQHFLAWRNKHIAHSVNGYEVNYLYAEFTSEPPVCSKIAKIGVAETRITGLSSQELTTIARLVGKFTAGVTAFISQVSPRVLEAARAAPDSVIVLAGDAETIFPDSLKISKARKRH